MSSILSVVVWSRYRIDRVSVAVGCVFFRCGYFEYEFLERAGVRIRGVLVKCFKTVGREK
jgi:hypothetical protein